MQEENILEGVKKKQLGGETIIPEVKLQFHKGEIMGRITSSANCAELLRKLYSEGTIELQEQVYVLYMNRRNEVIGYYRHSTGGVTSAIMDIKLILSAALKCLSSSLIISHNHPSGGLEPSHEDRVITKKIKEGARSLDMQLLDHIILTKDGYYSFGDEGALDGIKNQYEEQADVLYDKTSSHEKEARKAAKKLIRPYVERGETPEDLKKGQLGTYNGDFWAHVKGNKIFVEKANGVKVDYSFTIHSIYTELMEELSIKGNTAKVSNPINTTKNRRHSKKSSSQNGNSPTAKEVEKIAEEIRFIKRYSLLDGKSKTVQQLLTFLNSLQKAILEKRIRKTSPFRKEVEYMQENLLKITRQLNKIPQETKRIANIKLKPEILKKFTQIGNSQRVRLSVNYLKRYIGIQGKNITKEKAQKLFDALKKAARNRKIVKGDPFETKLESVYSALHSFISKAKPKETLSIHSEVLNGLNSVLGSCDCENHQRERPNLIREERENIKENTVMNSIDFANLKFDSLGFSGKWKQLIGDPSAGFSAMVFGKPKMGKSYLCVDFAGYLARNHGNTLYVAKEEKLDATLQKKLTDKDVKHRCLFVADYLPDDLSPYEFIFLDSVSKLRLTPNDLERLKSEYPGKSFIEIYQTTKTGNFRGTNEHQHDVDVVIEVPEKGKAVQFGRFNQGGEMEIFADNAQSVREVNPTITKKNKKFDILSPDGFSIRVGVEPFDSLEEAEDYFTEWKNGYKRQGYYSSVPYGRITIEDLKNYCRWIELD